MRKSLRELGLDELLEKCQEEQARPREQEEGYCFEMFRRMIEDQNDAAMTCIYYLCKRWEHKWVKSSKLYEGEAEDIFYKAQEKMRRTCSKKHTPLAKHFKHSGDLFCFLQKCVTSIAIDHWRRKERERKLIERLKESLQAEFLAQPWLEDRIYRRDAIQLVVKWIRGEATPREKLLIKLLFVDELTAPQIVKRYPDKFPDEQTVYTEKYRILEKIRQYLADHGYGSEKRPR